ncbi:MAG: hypothetical protein ACYCW6_22030 [Candidatus Xenobia bacterium]
MPDGPPPVGAMGNGGGAPSGGLSGLGRALYGQAPSNGLMPEIGRGLVKTFHNLTFHLFDSRRR